jgi:hypothetical protein
VLHGDCFVDYVTNWLQYMGNRLVTQIYFSADNIAILHMASKTKCQKQLSLAALCNFDNLKNRTFPFVKWDISFYWLQPGSILNP